jgi:hypothetical protein
MTNGGNMSKGKSLIATLFCGVVIAGASASAAFAGEVTGTEEQKPTGAVKHANSICVFSGKNDDPDRPLTGFDPGGVSQSYGQENRLGLQDPRVFNPGDACKGGSNFARE